MSRSVSRKIFVVFIHIVLATLATAGFVAVAASAISNDDNSHAGLGIGSTALAVIPILVLKF
jgi:hypothetical protein